MWYSEFCQYLDLFVHTGFSEEHCASIFSVEIMEMKKKVSADLSFGEKSICFYDPEVRNSNYSILLLISLFLKIFFAKKECTACSRTSHKIVLLINCNNGKSEIKANINNNSVK